MKKIKQSDKITTRLKAAFGDGANVEDLSVFEAIALNTLPLRKNHPLYKGAVTERGILVEMAETVNKESIPLQIMHDGSALPLGRVFQGEVFNTGAGAELRVLFAVSNSEGEAIRKIDNGTIDQVSVSILPKQILCNQCGFDYLGSEAKSENIWTATCSNGHTLGKGNVHANVVGLQNFSEMSLVGKGGAQNARIVSPDSSLLGSHYQRLAASGVDPDKLMLTATEGTKLMDLETLVAQLTDAKASKLTLDAQVATLTADLTNSAAKVATLTAELEAAKAEAAKAAPEVAELSAATDYLKDLAKKVLVATGDMTPTVPEKTAELIEVIKTKGGKMLELLQKSTADEKDEGTDIVSPAVSLSAFRTRA